MKKIILGLCLGVVIFFNISQAQDKKIEMVQIENTWMRMPLGTVKNTAIYFKITNNSTQTLTLIGANTNLAKKTQVHETIIENEIGKMRHKPKLEIQPNQTIEFKSGGMHIMLMGLNKEVNVNDIINFDLIFQNEKYNNTYQAKVLKNRK